MSDDPKPCTHLRANHRHGTALAYQKDACRCQPCRVAGRRNRKATEYRTLTGSHSYVPAARARVHAQQLLEVLTVGQIEQRSGVNRTSIRVLVGDFPGRPPSKRITRTTERALLAVRDERVGAELHGLVDGTGTRRRLRALIALGWPARTLAARLHFSSRTAWTLTGPTAAAHEPVRISTRDAVRRLYDDLSFTIPPPCRAATRVRNLAATRGWPPPLAWDDDTIDDPAARPSRGIAVVVDEVAVQEALAGRVVTLSRADTRAAVEQLTAAGASAAEIAARLGTYQRKVNRIRARNALTHPAAPDKETA